MAIITGRSGADNLRGTNGVDWIDGGAGDDTINGMGGADAVFGGAGRDTVDGGAGSDYVDGGLGDDLLVYTAAENRGSYDVYNGGLGRDTLRLRFTAAEWADAAVRQDVHRFHAFLPEYNEPLGWLSDPVFLFRSIGLGVVGINKFEVLVDGKAVNTADAPVAAADDAAALGEDEAGVTVDVLANDLAVDGVRSVSIAKPANGAVELVSTSFAGAKPSAVVKFTPGDAFQHLKQGEVAVEAFTYTVTDMDGDVKTATVQVRVTGTNDAPVAVAATPVHIDGSATLLTGNVAANDRDVDAEAGELVYDYAYWLAPRGFFMDADGSWTFDEGYQALPGALRAGENRVFEIPYTVTDAQGARTEGVLTLTIRGVNDAPDVHHVEADIEENGYGYADDDGTLVRYVTIDFHDRDSATDDLTVTILDAPADPVGTLEFDYAYDGSVVFSYRIDPAVIAALGEGQDVVQNYRVRLDDGDGGVVELDVPVRVVGDGEDPTVFYDDDPPHFEEEALVRTAEVDFAFEDDDFDEEIRFEVRPVDHALGSWTIGEVFQNDERRYVTVTFTYSYAELDAFPDDRTELRYEVVAIDAAGKETVVDYRIQPRHDHYLVGDDGDNILDFTQLGTDILIGNGGNDALAGDRGRDYLYGDEGPDVPAHEDTYGEYASTWLDPVAGYNDELDGGSDADTLHGGGGADRFLFRPGEADGDTVLDFDPASGDVLEFHDYGKGATLTRLDGERWAVASADGSVVDVIRLANGVDLSADDYRFVERPVLWTLGTELNESVYGWYDQPNVLVGNGGSDLLLGSGWNDELHGDEGPTPPDGAEVVRDAQWRWASDEYDDELDGRGGADLLVGGAGADRFIFGREEAQGDVVRDFNGEEGDRLDFTGFGWGATFTQLDATRWQVSDAEGLAVEVITFENAPTILPEHVLIYGF